MQRWIVRLKVRQLGVGNEWSNESNVAVCS